MTFSRRLYIWWFLIRRIPIIPFLGIRVEHETAEECRTSIRKLWRNRNPFGITYFAALIAAGEMAAGTLVVQRLIEALNEGYKIGLVIDACEAQFSRPAIGPITFTCVEGYRIDGVIDNFVDSSIKFITFTTYSSGRNEKGKLVASILLRWKFYKL
jgi:hypothetical protein